MKDSSPLLDNFFALFETKQQGLDYINNATGRVYKYSSIYTWADPTRPNPSQDVYELMVRDVLKANGYTDLYNDLIRHLYIIKEK